MATAYYLRVSSKSQDTKSQEADMKAHAEREAGAVWYRDKFTGKTLTRPGWERLWADVLRVRWTAGRRGSFSPVDGRGLLGGGR